MDDEIDIKGLRERLGWNQRKLAEYLHLDRASVSRMENGQAPKGPTLILLRQILAEAESGSLKNSGVDA